MEEQASVRASCPVCGQRVDLVPFDHRVAVLRGMVGYHRPWAWSLGAPHEWCPGSGRPTAEPG